MIKMKRSEQMQITLEKQPRVSISLNGLGHVPGK